MRTPEAPFAISLYMMFCRFPKVVPGKHATMITQVGISPSTITNWAMSPKGLVIWDIDDIIELGPSQGTITIIAINKIN